MAEICHLIHNNGDLDKVDRQQQPMPLEFDVDPSENRVARYKLAPGWESPRVLVTHVPKRFLPDQVLSQNKGKVMCGNERTRRRKLKYGRDISVQTIPVAIAQVYR